MKLPDFLAFEPFNTLRERMGAQELGQFEFFDPRLHLTADERDTLAEGLTVTWQALRCLHDYTLAFKNSRVLLWREAPGEGGAAPEYHLAYCRRLQALRRADADGRVRVATQLPPPDPWPWRVCRECLQQLQFRGFDAARARHRDYSDRVLEEFSLDDFWRNYPPYPVRADLLRGLDSVA